MSDPQAGVVPTPPSGPQTLNVAGQTVRIQNVNLLTSGGQQYVFTSGAGLGQVGNESKTLHQLPCGLILYFHPNRYLFAGLVTYWH